MSIQCSVCHKIPQVGNRVSHAHNITKRRWLPNLQHVRVQTPHGAKRVRVCTRCIKSGKIQKAA